MACRNLLSPVSYNQLANGKSRVFHKVKGFFDRDGVLGDPISFLFMQFKKKDG